MARKKILLRTKKQTNYPSSDAEKIRQRAYFIWEERGRPQNSDMDIWLQAEQELKR